MRSPSGESAELSVATFWTSLRDAFSLRNI